MFIIGLNGSPQDENTYKMLEVALAEGEKLGARTMMINVSDALKGLKNPFCTNCTTPCSGVCFKDSYLAEVFELFGQCDGMLIGSPVYFGTVSGQLKALWDKSRRLRYDKKLVNVVGGALSVGASRFGGQETTLRAIHDMMLVQGMTVVGDGYIENDAGHQGACGQKTVEQDENGLNRAKILMRRIVEVAKATEKLRNRDLR